MSLFLVPRETLLCFFEKVGVDLEQESDAAGFLGVRLERDPDTGLLEMKQTGLIDRILETLGLNVGLVNGKAMPAEHAPLTKDEDGPPASGSFNYTSVVGMLLYLSGHSRPDIRTQSIVQLATCSVLDALMRRR